MAGKTKGAADHHPGRQMPNASERARNMASPLPVVQLYNHLSVDQKGAISNMDLEPMLDIKCHVLHNPLINYLGPLYDKHNREFVNPSHGRIPLNAYSVYHTLGLPRGELAVRYCVDAGIEARLGPVIFPNHSSTPKISEVCTMLQEMTDFEDRFKQLWIMYLVRTLLCPTTCNKVSNMTYPIMDNFGDVQNMNLCQFGCDKLHEELLADKLSSPCLFHLQLLYVDSLDVSALNLNLPEGRFVVNIWSKQDVDTVLDADLKRDGSGFGNLELKPHLSINLKFFGGAAAFEQWIDTNSAPNCPKPRQEKVARLIEEFASGMTGLLGKLVQGWAELDDNDGVQMEHAFGNVARAVGIDGALDGGGTRGRTFLTDPPRSGSGSPRFTTSHLVPPRSDAPSPNPRSPQATRAETGAASKEIVAPLSPVTRSPSIRVANSHDLPVARVTRSAAKGIKIGQFADKGAAIRHIQSVGNSSMKESSHVSVPRVTRSATKATRTGPSRDEAVDMSHAQSGGESSNKGSFDSDYDPDHTGGDDDDVDHYIIQSRDCDVQPGLTDDCIRTRGEDSVGADSVVVPSLMQLAGASSHVGEDVLNTHLTGPSDGNNKKCPELDKLAKTASLHLGSEPENKNQLSTEDKDVQGVCQFGAVAHVTSDSGSLHVNCAGDVMRNDGAEKSADNLCLNATNADVNQVSDQVQLAESLVLRDTTAHAVNEVKN